MIEKSYRVADKVVTVHSIYEMVHDVFNDYRTDEAPDYEIWITEDDIANERAATKSGCSTCRSAYLEVLAVYRKMAEQLVEFDRILFHGSVVAVNGQGYLFSAKSGVGKSTHASLWLEHLSNAATIINDDKPLLYVDKDRVVAYGTPLNGKHNRGTNASVPLKAICFLHRDIENHIERVTFKEHRSDLLGQVYWPAELSRQLKTLALIDQLERLVEAYSLGCNTDVSAARVSYEGMR